MAFLDWRKLPPLPVHTLPWHGGQIPVEPLPNAHPGQLPKITAQMMAQAVPYAGTPPGTYDIGGGLRRLPPGQARMTRPAPPAPKPRKPSPLVDSHGRKTLSFDQYHANTGGDHAGYQKYLRYVHNVRAAIDAKAGKPTVHGAPAATVEDPNDPSTWSIFQQTPEAQGLAAAKKAGLAAFAPAIAQENQGYAADQKRVGETITNYTRGLAAFLGGQPSGIEDMRNVQASIAASNAALGEQATGQAAQGQQGFADWLARSGAPAAAGQPGADIAARGQSVAGDIAAAGQAGYEGAATRQGTLAGLLSGLPAITAMQGRRTLSDQLSGLAQTHAKQIGGLRSDLAAAIQKEYDNFHATELQKGAARATYARYGAATQAGVTKAVVSAKAGRTKAQIAADARVRAANIAAGGARARAQIAADARIKAARIAAKASAAKSAAAGSGGLTKDQQKAINTAETRAHAAAAAAAHMSGVKKTVTKPNPYPYPGHETIQDTVTVQERDSSYKQAIEKVKARIRPILPWMSEDELTAFAQKEVNPFYPKEAKRGY